MRTRMTEDGDLPVIITPHAAFNLLTLKGTLNIGYLSIFDDQ